jgi:hypothetical protein
MQLRAISSIGRAGTGINEPIGRIRTRRETVSYPARRQQLAAIGRASLEVVSSSVPLNVR